MAGGPQDWPCHTSSIPQQSPGSSVLPFDHDAAQLLGKEKLENAQSGRRPLP